MGYIQLYLGGFDYFDQFWPKLLKFDFVSVPTDMTEISEFSPKFWTLLDSTVTYYENRSN